MHAVCCLLNMPALIWDLRLDLSKNGGMQFAWFQVQSILYTYVFAPGWTKVSAWLVLVPLLFLSLRSWLVVSRHDVVHDICWQSNCFGVTTWHVCWSCLATMKFSEQSQLLATAFANEPCIQRMAVNHAVVRVSTGKKIKRSSLWALCSNVCSLVMNFVSCLCNQIFIRSFAQTWDQGTLADNAEQIGHAVKHVGLRPSLQIIGQAIESFFALCLPRKHEVCGHMVASFCVLLAFGWEIATVPASKQHGGLTTWTGLRTKFHAKALMKMVFAFSRIAKRLACKFLIQSCVLCNYRKVWVLHVEEGAFSSRPKNQADLWDGWHVLASCARLLGSGSDIV